MKLGRGIKFNLIEDFFLLLIPDPAFSLLLAAFPTSFLCPILLVCLAPFPRSQVSMIFFAVILVPNRKHRNVLMFKLPMVHEVYMMISF